MLNIPAAFSGKSGKFQKKQQLCRNASAFSFKKLRFPAATAYFSLTIKH
jgi:hypothetical protein